MIDLRTLKTRLAQSDLTWSTPPTPAEINAAYTTLAAETQSVPREYRVTAITLAAEPPIGIGLAAARRVITGIRSAAASDDLTDEVLLLMRSGVGPDVSDAALQSQLDAMVVAAALQADDVAAIKALGTHATPAWPGLSVDLINQARAL